MADSKNESEMSPPPILFQIMSVVTQSLLEELLVGRGYPHIHHTSKKKILSYLYADGARVKHKQHIRKGQGLSRSASGRCLRIGLRRLSQGLLRCSGRPCAPPPPQKESPATSLLLTCIETCAEY